MSPSPARAVAFFLKLGDVAPHLPLATGGDAVSVESSQGPARWQWGAQGLGYVIPLPLVVTSLMG
jgi:hypothetical protein